MFPKSVVQVCQEEQVKFGEDGLGGGGVDTLVVLERGLEEVGQVGSSESSTRMVWSSRRTVGSCGNHKRIAVNALRA